MVTGSRAARDDFLSCKGWCPKEEPLQGVPTSHSSVNGEGSPCALTSLAPQSNTLLLWHLRECPEGEGPHEARLECSRTLMSQKKETKSLQVQDNSAGMPRGSRESAVLGHGEVPA